MPYQSKQRFSGPGPPPFFSFIRPADARRTRRRRRRRRRRHCQRNFTIDEGFNFTWCSSAMPSLSAQAPKISSLLRIRSKKRQLPCVGTAIINLASSGHLSEALTHLDLLACKGVRLPFLVIAQLLQRCGNSRSLREGTWIHLHLKLTGFKHPTIFISNHLINMYFSCGNDVEARKVFDKMAAKNLYSWNNMLSGYAKLGRMKPARKLFDQMPEKDVVSWNTMVIGYAKMGHYDEALRLYTEFRRKSIGFNAFSFAGLLTLCVKFKALQLTRQVHGQVLVAGFWSNVVLLSSILDAYAKCEELEEAKRLFDNMLVRDVLAWTTMVSGYAKFGDMDSASKLFDQMPEKNSVSWTALIAGYARNCLGHEALEMFKEMMIFQIRPDQYTFSSCLCACATISALKHGKQIHAYLTRTNFYSNTIVISSLIDMYSKCGNIEAGWQVFYLTSGKHDAVLWNTMMSALAQHGHGKRAIQLFNNMVKSGVKPDRITFIVILSGCSHSGMVQDGLMFFKSMNRGLGVLPDQEHYACLIDLLGRGGYFVELLNQLETMSCKPDDRVWNALLGVCGIHGNIELGKKVAEHVISLQPESSSAYVLLASMYATHGRWESMEKVREVMNDRFVKKERAISWIEIENKVHSFIVSDRLHPLKEDIYNILKQIAGHMEQNALN